MAYELIETITLASSASSIEFTSIPQDGVDLLLVYSGRSTASTTTAFLRFNNDTVSYSQIRLQGTGASAISASDTAIFLTENLSSSTANTFSNNQIYISNYAGSTQKSVSGEGVSENNTTSAFQRIIAGLYTQTTAITSMQITYTSDLVAGSTASLYKIS